MRIGRVAAAACALVLWSGSGQVRAQSVAGTYAIEFDYQVRRIGGAQGAQKAQATLEFAVKGDSIIGTWTMSNSGADRRPDEVRGTVQGNTIRFNIAGQARLMRDGTAMSVETIATYTATIAGDEIKGTIETRAVDSSFQMPARNLTGKRIKPAQDS